MTRHPSLLLATLLLAATAAHAEDQQRQRDRIHNPEAGTQVQQQTQAQPKTQNQVRQQEQVYGSQLMTPEERAAHRAKMLSAKTPEEREAIRMEHHKAMQERAKKQGLSLPDSPPAMGGGMGPGQGQGSGRGTGMGRSGGNP